MALLRLAALHEKPAEAWLLGLPPSTVVAYGDSHSQCGFSVAVKFDQLICSSAAKTASPGWVITMSSCRPSLSTSPIVKSVYQSPNPPHPPLPCQCVSHVA